MSYDPRQELVEICHLMAARNFTTAAGGNISVRMPDGTCWVTPSQLHKARVTCDDLVRVNAQLEVLDGVRRPSSEMLVHQAVYRALPQATAVIHAHPPIASGFAMAHVPLRTTSSSEGAVVLGAEVPCIPYVQPGTAALADLVCDAVDARHPAYLLANHGVLTWGTDLWASYDALDTLELFAHSLVIATILGGPRPLPDAELQALEALA
jgi:L-fuculose-phosphate aldolase